MDIRTHAELNKVRSPLEPAGRGAGEPSGVGEILVSADYESTDSISCPRVARKSSTAAAKFSQSAAVVGNDKEM
jgi:hypothetical protein